MTRVPGHAREVNPVLFPLSVAFLIGMPIAAGITHNWWLALVGPVGFFLGAAVAAGVSIYREAHQKEQQ